jgi:hypothetical protein
MLVMLYIVKYCDALILSSSMCYFYDDKFADWKHDISSSYCYSSNICTNKNGIK